MTHLHTEYPETERPGVPFVGYTDPHEQTASDDEVATIITEPYIPVRDRWHRFRLWKDEVVGIWIAMQPDQIKQPLFRHPLDGAPTNSFGSRSFTRALEEVQLALAKGDAALHLQEALS